MSDEAADVSDGGDDLKAGASGHVKLFAIGVIPYDHPLLPAAPQGQAFVDARLNLDAHAKSWFRAEVAHAVTATLGGGASLAIARTGVAPTAPQLFPLNWDLFAEEGSTFQAVGRTDRLWFRLSRPGLDLTVGRQPISFGSGTFFTPLDLVNPFTPATIDTEYKPGLDGARLDVYRGVSGQVTAAVVWTGEPVGSGSDTNLRANLTVAAFGQGTVGSTDLGAFLGLVHGDAVAGLTARGSLGPVGVHADGTVTAPPGDEPWFTRIVVGADGRPTGWLTLSGELYYQSSGKANPDEYLTVLAGPRYVRGELWLAGRVYGGVAAQVQVTPLLTAGVASFVNLEDPSAMIAPTLSWSVAEDADVVVGGYAGWGSRPTVPANPPGFGVRSEFGLYPAVVFVQARSYF
jgi:hypothetical protein